MRPTSPADQLCAFAASRVPGCWAIRRSASDWNWKISNQNLSSRFVDNWTLQNFSAIWVSIGGPKTSSIVRRIPLKASNRKRSGNKFIDLFLSSINFVCLSQIEKRCSEWYRTKAENLTIVPQFNLNDCIQFIGKRFGSRRSIQNFSKTFGENAGRFSAIPKRSAISKKFFREKLFKLIN